MKIIFKCEAKKLIKLIGIDLKKKIKIKTQILDKISFLFFKKSIVKLKLWKRVKMFFVWKTC